MTLILSGTDGVSDVDGSAATPAVRGADANTGIFFPAADTIGFSEGGVEVARITNTSAWSFGASGTATGTNGQVLTSAGSAAAPAWANPATVNLATGVTGTLPVANGGTGQTALSAVAVGTSTNLAGGSNGTIPYQSAAGTTQMLAVGTAGQVLQTNGAGAPTWVTPGGGSLIFLQAVIASNSAEIDLTAFSSTYDDYTVIFENAQSSTTDNNRLVCRFRINGTWQEGSSYEFARHRMRPNDGNYSQTQSASINTIQLTGDMWSDASAGPGAAAAGTLWLYGVNSAIQKIGLFQSYCRDSSVDQFVSYRGHGGWGASAGVLSGVRFLMSGSPLATGIFRLYGIKKN